MRSALLVCDRAALLKHLRQHFAINWHGDHGASHWARVRNNGLMIAAATGANMAVVELFAFFHDSCRVNEFTDHDHGKRGADLAFKLQASTSRFISSVLASNIRPCSLNARSAPRLP